MEADTTRWRSEAHPLRVTDRLLSIQQATVPVPAFVLHISLQQFDILCIRDTAHSVSSLTFSVRAVCCSPVRSSVCQLKLHPFFADIDWSLLAERKLPPPFKPNVQRLTDTDNFDVEFTSMPLHSHEANKHTAPHQPAQQQNSAHSGQHDGSHTESTHSAEGSGSKCVMAERAAGALDGVAAVVDDEDEDEDEGADGDAADAGQFANFTFVSHDYL